MISEREIIEGLFELCRLTDGFRAPNHRNTIEDYVAQRETIRDRARRLYHGATGEWPGDQVATSAAIRRPPSVPAAILRNQRRVEARRQGSSNRLDGPVFGITKTIPKELPSQRK